MSSSPWNYQLPDHCYGLPRSSTTGQLYYNSSPSANFYLSSSASYPPHMSSAQSASGGYGGHGGRSMHVSADHAFTQSRHGTTQLQTATPIMSSRTYSQSSSSPISDEASPGSDNGGETKKRHFCHHPDCRDKYGQPNVSFSRKADVSRHWDSTHEPRYYDCPKNNCSRKGKRGFTRRDHMIEHQRGYHGQQIAKRTSSHDGRDFSPEYR